MNNKIANPFDLKPLPPHLVFEALSKGLNVQYAEVNTNDWSILSPNSTISISDINSGFLKFCVKNGMDDFEKVNFRNKGSQFFYEFLNEDADKNLRFRVGFDNPTIYILVRRKEIHRDLKPLDRFDIYKEIAIGQRAEYCLNRETISDKLLTGLNRAYQAKSTFDYNQVLEQSGHFASEDYKNYRKQYKGR